MPLERVKLVFKFCLQVGNMKLYSLGMTNRPFRGGMLSQRSDVLSNCAIYDNLERPSRSLAYCKPFAIFRKLVHSCQNSSDTARRAVPLRQLSFLSVQRGASVKKSSL